MIILPHKMGFRISGFLYPTIPPFIITITLQTEWDPKIQGPTFWSFCCSFKKMRTQFLVLLCSFLLNIPYTFQAVEILLFKIRYFAEKFTVPHEILQNMDFSIL